MIYSHNRNIVYTYLLIIVLILIIYLPFVIKGGPGSGDDLGFHQLHNKNFMSIVNEFMISNEADRPVANFFLSGSLYLYNNVHSYYIYTGLILWLIIPVIIYNAIKVILSKRASLIISILLCFPIISTTVLSSPYLFSEYIIPILFWSLSIYFILNFTVSKNPYFYFLWILFSGLGLFTLSYIFPLIVLSIFLPFSIDIKNTSAIKKTIKFKIFLKYSFPMVFLSGFFVYYKIYIVPLYSEFPGIYGLAPFSLKSVFQGFYYFITFTFEIPILLLGVIPHIFNLRIISLFLR